MTDINNDNSPTVNILPSDTHGDILVQLIKGQERAATQIEMQNRRLFGGDGMAGMLPAIIEQHKNLATKLDDNKEELVKKIENFKETLATQIEVVDAKHTELDKKVNWYAGGIATMGTIITLVLGYLGIYHRSH